MKIVVIQNEAFKNTALMRLSDKDLEKVRKIVPEDLVLLSENNSKATQEAEIVIAHEFSDVDMKLMPNLKWIHVTSAGVNAMPMEIVKSEILVTNSSGVHPIPIAEHVFAMILMFSRQLIVSYRTQILERKWVRDMNKLQISELYGKTVLIVGLGRIGMRVAELARTFGMKVTATSRTKHVKPQHVDKLVTNYELDSLLPDADFVVNCLPETDETRGLFDAKKFKLMKPSSYFINIGRGTTVREMQLIEFVKSKKIAGAGLDVFEQEPLSPTSPLWNLENVILTPHYAGWTPEYMNRVLEIFCENLKAYLSRKPMPNLIDKEEGY